MKSSISNYLVEKYDLDSSNDVRHITQEGYEEGAIEVFGTMPNTNEEGWFFAGYDSEIEAEIKELKM